MLTETASPFSFIPSNGAYRQITACISAGRADSRRPLILIKSVFTVDMEAYPFSGVLCTIMALQVFQSKFLPNKELPFSSVTDIVLHPNGILPKEKSAASERTFSVK